MGNGKHLKHSVSAHAVPWGVFARPLRAGGTGWLRPLLTAVHASNALAGTGPTCPG